MSEAKKQEQPGKSEQGEGSAVNALVRPTEIWNSLFWSYNLPLQMWPNEDNTFSVVDYMPRKETVVRIDKRVTPSELPQFCQNTAVLLRHLANRFDALGRGEIDSIYYHDEDL